MPLTSSWSTPTRASTPPHPENPSWDPDGSILIEHFQAAEAIWESLLPGGGEYTFDFHWDNDIPGLGLYTPGADEYIEINPDFDWFADPDPWDTAEFNPGVQILYSGLSTPNQTTYFPGTVPPGALEVSFRSNGISNGTLVGGVAIDTLSASGQNLPGTTTRVDASNGFDLLSTIVHEIGHALGINGEEPGEYNIDPQHVGGLTNVLVLEDNDSGHLAGHFEGPPTAPISVPGYLMCESCALRGQRRFATATDVLVIAEDQGITVVQLARVGRISSGVWSDASAWIGGDVPDSTQDVYISHGGTVTLDADTQAKDLLVSSGSTLAALNHQFRVNGTLTLNSGTASVTSGGTIAANSINVANGTLSATAGSLVRFNGFAAGSTSASFGGSVAIGYYAGSTDPATFNPSAIADWNIAEQLTVGGERNATLVIDNGTWNVGGNVDVRGDSLGFSEIIVDTGGTLNVSGSITAGLYGKVTYKNSSAAANRPYEILGGSTARIVPPPPANPYLSYAGGGSLTFQDSANAADASITVYGGAGEGGPGGSVTFKGDTSAGDASPAAAQFHTKGGIRGSSLNPLTDVAGKGGIVRFEGTSGASNANINNDGVEYYLGTGNGTGGRTIFVDTASAEQSTIHNHGTAYINGDGGATEFYNNSTAASATITNHADGTTSTSAFYARGRTVFFDSSDAGNATIENEGAPYNPGGSTSPGLTEFRNNSSAAFSNIHNRAQVTTSGLGAGSAGHTRFYDSASAADATIHTYEGTSDMGRVEFHNQSTAARARIIVENVPSVPGNGGGYVIFRDSSTAAQSQIFLRAGTVGFGGLSFLNNSRAADTQILTEDLSGNISFQGTSTAGDPVGAPTAATALFSVGRGSAMSFYDQTKAEDAGISLAHGSSLFFQNNSSAGQAQIAAAGSSVFGIEGAAITFNTSSLVNNATITLGGGMASQATGARVLFNNGSHAGDSTITANGGTNGGGGATITFSNSYGDTAQIIANAGSTVDFVLQPTFNNHTTTLGSIDGAGKFVLRGSHLITGSRNTSTIVSGPIVDNPPGSATGGRLTKVGTGTLTLAGANTYSGLTTVNAGTISITGSIAGGTVVNSGGTLNGTGTIGGTVTVNSGGLLAPGTSAGALTAATATILSGSSLNIELGGANAGSQYDQLLVSGALTLDGALNVSLINGFIPSAGQAFNILDWGSLAGTFSSLNLPTLTGVTWNTSQLYVTGVLSVALPGDFNNDGRVDAADYIVWRKTDGAPEGFNAWRANFGRIGAGSGAGGSVHANVPEPATVVLLTFAAAVWCLGEAGPHRKSQELNLTTR